MQKIRLNIVALAHSEHQPGNFVVILGEETGERRLPVVIGSFEAQAIAMAAEGVKPARPLTHDLLFNTLQTFDIRLDEVFISELTDGVFHAKLVCENKSGEKTEVDSRTSDALALAMRFGCPVYTMPHIMEAAGVELEISETQEEKEIPRGQAVEEYSINELQKLLAVAVEEEDYEEAARLRDEIDRRAS